jgi:hypothetical protein
LGKEFSPWSMGPPIPTAFDFSIANRLAEIEAERGAQEAMGYESEDEHEVENHTLPPSPPLDTWSATPLFTLSPLTPIHDPVELPLEPMSPLPPPTSSVLKQPPSPKPAKKSKTKPRHKKTDHRTP